MRVSWSTTSGKKRQKNNLLTSPVDVLLVCVDNLHLRLMTSGMMSQLFLISENYYHTVESLYADVSLSFVSLIILNYTKLFPYSGKAVKGFFSYFNKWIW